MIKIHFGVQRPGLFVFLLTLILSFAGWDHAEANTPPDTVRTNIHTERIPGTNVRFEMIRHDGGTITVSDEETEEVRTVPAFWIGKTEVTWDLYDVYVFEQEKTDRPGVDAVSRPSKPYVLPGESFGHRGLPALGMTERAAKRFVDWLAAVSGHPYRLLTEDEWELVCTEALSNDPALTSIAWFSSNSNYKTHAVGTLEADGFGTFDLLGNAAEWVIGRDGRSVVKGGSWRDDADKLTCQASQRQARSWNATDPQIPKSRWWLSDGHFLGLRVGMDAE